MSNNMFTTDVHSSNVNNEIKQFMKENQKSDDMVTFLNALLKEDNAVVSGSLVLKAINNDNYKINDMDIYISNKHLIAGCLENKSKLMSYLKKPRSALMGLALDIGYELRSCDIQCSYTGMRDLLYVVSFVNVTNHVIQFIICEDYKKTISNFDLNINKNYWDGEKTHITHPNNVYSKTEKLSLHIRNKLDYYTLARITKYRSRGYNIELIELTTILPKSIYNSSDLLNIINKTFENFVFE